VPASAVQDAADLLDRDPQLAARRHFVRLDHPVMGTSVYSGIPYRLSRTPGRLRSPAPLLGADTHDVCTRLLGLDEADHRRLTETGAIG
jgi:benzylsuccinate CoA-transferase BbsF subunit